MIRQGTERRADGEGLRKLFASPLLSPAERPAPRERQPEDIPVPLQRAVHVGHLDPHVAYAVDSETLSHGGLLRKVG